MPKSTSGRSKNGSEVSSRSERRRAEDEEASETRSKADSTTASSTSRRRSSKRTDEDEGFMPTTTSFSSSSRSPYSGVAAPSVASSYATALPNEHPEYNRPDLVRNESMAQAEKKQRKEARRDSGRTSQSERSRGIEEAYDNGNVDRADSERSSRRESRKSSRSDKKEKTRSQDEHDNALPQHQFPGQSPAQYTEPYRPPGLASEYYGDHGESVSYQPGVRPNAPSIIETADQAHLMEPTTEAKPPPEPSSIGQVGASASFYAMDEGASDGEHQSTPTKPGRKPSKKPSRYSNGGTPRSSPEDGRVSSSGLGLATGGAAMGAAAEYFTGNISTSTTEQVNQSAQSGRPYQTTSPESFTTPTRPSRLSNMDSGSSSHHYGGAAAAGLAGAAAGAYFADHGNNGSGNQSGYPPNRPNPEFVLGQNQSAFPQMQRHRTKPRGPLGKLANWWKAPEDVAQMEAYTEAIGVCRDCFDPGSSPMDAPRRHHHHKRRRSGDRYGSTTRVDKAYRYSSDEERRRGSTAAKLAAGGLAGYGAAKIGKAMYTQKNDFDDTYSVKSGRPANRSRVSFKEEDERFSARTYSNNSQNTAALERRDSGRKSRRDSERYEKRSSRRRDSSSGSSTHGMSKTTAMGIGAAGIAMGAAAGHERRKSRSRSRSPIKRKRSYYHQRISPRHSYVDLSTTNQGPLGLGGFFSPSSNKKKGKKAKGFFSFSNASSSSSDADLAFGQGTVKRKDSRKGQPSDKYGDGSTAALMGLAATGAALAAESDRRKNNGKDRRYADDSTDRHRRTSSGKIRLADHETTTDGENDDAWEDATDDDKDNASVDSGLAYGGRASAAASRESLPQTDYWQWRKKKSREDLRRQSQSDANGIDTVVAGGIGLAAGAAALNAMSSAKNSGRRTDSLPGMQQLDPVPTSDPTFFEAQRVSGISPTSIDRPQRFADASPIPLSQPQPITPVASIPGAFDRYEDERVDSRRRTGSVDRSRPSQPDDRGRQRRDSSPAKLESRGDRDGLSRDDVDTNEDDIRAKREAEIEAELQKLYDEDRRRKEERRKRKEDERQRKIGVAGVAATAAVVGAGIAGAVASKDRSSSEERERPKRKSSMKKSKDRASSPPNQTQQERIARMAAQRVRSTPSPVYDHEDYSTFFVPKELAEHVKEHNDASAARVEDAAQVVEIVPGGPKRAETFDSFLYRPFGIEPDDDPTAYPWPVPMLGLVEPTPPSSVTHSRRGTPSPVVQPKDLPDEDFGEPMERKSSKVTWGDHDTYVYEVVTPEWERADFMPGSPEKGRSPTTEVPPSLDQQESTKETRPRSKLSRIYTLDDEVEDKSGSTAGIPPVEEMTAEQREHLSKGHDFADMPGSFEDREPAQEDHEPTPTTEVNLEDVLGSEQFYKGPSSGTVDDSKDEVPNTGHGFIEDTEIPATPRDEVPSMSGGVHDEDEISDAREVVPEPRQSRSEKRRMERIPPSAEAVPISFENAAPPPPAPPMPTTADLKQTPSSSVFDYLVGDDGKSLPSTSALEATAGSVMTSGKVSPRDASNATSEPEQNRSAMLDDIKNFKFSKPRRAETFDDTKTGRQSSKSKSDYTSDPEDWERSSSKKDKSKSKSDVSAGGMAAMAGIAAAAAAAAKNREADFYDNNKKKSRRSQQESENADEDDVKSASSMKGRRRSNRDSGTNDDDDAVSVASSTTSRKSKKSSDDKKDKKASGGIWGSIFGTKSDVSSSSKKSTKSTKSEGRGERSRDRNASGKKRRSDADDIDDAVSAASEPTAESRHDSEPRTDARDVQQASRDETIHDNFVPADEQGADVSTAQHADESLKAERLEMSQPMDIPMATDGVSGLETEGQSSALPSTPDTYPLSSDQAARDATLRALVGETSPMSSDASLETRKASQLKTSDLPASPAITSSPTAVPFRYQRLPISPATPRASWSSPVATPSSPLRTPRTRQDRPKSTEFRSSKEVRPLYLVQKTKAEQTPTPEVEEDLPSLPSSRTSSAHPSMEDLHGAARAQSQQRIDSYFPSQDMTPQQRLDRGRRQSWSYWHDTPDTAQRRISPDYLDSRSATPVPANVQRAREVDTRGRKERPKYEFHSPSELLQDPAGVVDEAGDSEPKSGSPLPSVVSTENDADFMSARSGSPAPATSDLERRRSRSRSKSRSRGRSEMISTAGLGIAAAAAVGVTASEVVASRKRRADGGEEVEDVYGGEALRSAPSPPTLDSSKSNAPAAEENFQPALTTDTPTEELDDWAVPTSKSKKEKRKSKSEGVAEFSAPVPPVSTTPAEVEEEWAQIPGKKSKKDKKKKAKRQDSLPALDIEAAEARDENGERALLPDEDEPLTAVPSEKSMQGEPSHQHDDLQASRDLEPEVQDVAETLDGRRVSLPEQAASTGDLTQPDHRALLGSLHAPGTDSFGLELPSGLSEHGSRSSFPWDNEDAFHTPLAEEEARELGIPETIPEDRPLDLSRDVTRTPSEERAPDLSGDVAAFGAAPDNSDTRELGRTASFVPPSELLNSEKNDLGAFEEAFERAIRARGLCKGITREDALEVFLPRRRNAPFVAKGGLTPIDGSLAPTPEDTEPARDLPSTQEDLAPAVATALAGLAIGSAGSKKSKKEKKSSKKAGKRDSSGLRDSTVNENDEPGGEETLSEAQPASEKPEPVVDDLVSRDSAPQETLRETPAFPDSGERPNPFGNDFEIREADDAIQPIAADDSGAVRDPKDETAEAAEDFSWAPATKKDKKKRKQSQTSAPLDTSNAAEVTPIETTAEPAETLQAEVADEWAPTSSKKSKKDKKSRKSESSTPLETSTPAEETPIETPAEPVELTKDVEKDEWASTSSKKAKKDKKKKKQTLDWTDEVAPAAVVAAAVGAGAAVAANIFADDKDKEVVAEPEDIAEAAGDPAPAPQDVLAEDTTEATRDVEVPPTKPDQTDDFADSLISGKKGKKDKKKKKSRTFDWDEPPSETPESNTTPAEDPTVNPAIGSTEEPQTSLEPSLAPEVELLEQVGEVPAGPETAREVADDEWAATTKKSKKDKKKAKKSKTLALDDLDNELNAQEAGTAPVESKEIATPEKFDAVANDKDLNLPSIASSVPSIPDVETLEHADRLASASAKDLHDAPSHQDFLTSAHANVSAFPSKPVESLEIAAEKDLEVVSTQPALTTAATSSVHDSADDESNFTTKKPDETKEAVAEVFTQQQEQILPPDVVKEPIMEVPERAVANDASTEDIETIAESPAEEPGWFAWATGKKGKKDKKKDKKRSSIAWDEPETASPVPEPTEPVSQDPPSEEAGAGKAVAAASSNEPPADTSRDQQDDLSWEPSTTVKKSKKDKKKRKSLAWADDDGSPLVTTPQNEQADSPAVVQAEEAAAVEMPAAQDDTRLDENIIEEPEQLGASGMEGFVESQPQSLTIAKEPDLVVPPSMPEGTRDLAAPEITPSTTQELPAIEEATPSAEPEDFAWAPATKKSKKEKKKKRATVFDLEPPVETSTPEPESVEGEETVRIQEVSDAGQANDEQIPAQEVPVVEPAVADEDWGFATKKSKKDKKKRASTVDIDESASTSTPETGPVSAEVEIPVETPSAAAEPAAGDEDWGVPSKKSKKDKKKKRASAFDFDEPIETTPIDANDSLEQADPDVTQEQVLSQGRLLDKEIGTGDHLAPSQSEQVLPVESEETVPVEAASKPSKDITAEAHDAPRDDSAPVDQNTEVVPEDDWGFSTKKGKKDKKKKSRSSTFDLDDSAPATPADQEVGTTVPESGRDVEETPSARELDSAAPETIPAEPTATEPAPEEEWGFSTKKSKKDKKKKRASTFDLEDSTPSTPAEDPVAPVATVLPAETREVDDIATEMPAAETAEHVQQPVQDDDDWAVPAKQSKKDRKKRASALVLEDLTPATPPEEKAPEIIGEPDDDTRRNADVGLDTPTTQTVEDLAQPTQEEDWAAPAKKSKKDKKNKRASTFDLDDSTPVTPAAETPVEPLTEPSVDSDRMVEYFPSEPAMTASTDDTPAPEVAEDEWAVPTKKSKKDKKKKRASGFASEGVTPDVETPVDELKDAGREVVPENLPAKSTPQPISDETALEPLRVPTPVDVTAEPEPEAWGFSTKKSKKDKKQRRSIPGTFAEDESGTATPITPAEIETRDPETRQPIEDSNIRDIVPQADPARYDEPMIEVSIQSPSGSIQDIATSSRAQQELNSDEQPALADEPPASLQEPAQPAPEPTADEEWGFSTKKSKKDKKKKRQSTIQDVPESSTPDTDTAAVATSTEPIAEPITERAITAEEPSALDATREQSLDDEDVADADDQPIDWARDPWAMTTKKSKKDKKKSKSTVDEPDRDLGESADSSRRTKAMPNASSAQEKAAWLIAEAFGQSSRSPSRSREDNPVEEPVDAPLSSRDIQPESMSDAVAPQSEEVTDPAPEPEWGFSTKKSKKDKKKKRQSTVDDTSSAAMDEPTTGDRAIEENRQTSVQEHHNQPSHQDFLAGAHENASTFPANSTYDVKTVVDRNSGLASEAVRAVRNNNEEPAQSASVVEEEPTSTIGKKSKKDKKRKKRQSAYEEEEPSTGLATPVEEEYQPVGATRDTIEEASAQRQDSAFGRDVDEAVHASVEGTVHEMGENDDWQAPTKQSKKDKKKKKRQSELDDLVDAEPMPDSLDTSNDFPRPDPMAVDTVSEEPRVYRDGSTRDPEPEGRHPSRYEQDIQTFDDDVPERFEAPSPPPAAYMQESDPPSTQAAGDDWYSAPKPKKSKKGRKGRASTDDYYNGNPTHDEEPSSSRAPLVDEPRDIVMGDSDHGSQISDSTRERRKRRRSPPLQLGHDPEDLPRHGALTPPPEGHQDIMNTALGVATGMGLAGSDRGHERDHESSRDMDAPRDDPSWSFANVQPSKHESDEANRDSGVTFTESPMLGQSRAGNVRDSGYAHSPSNRHSWAQDPEHESRLRPTRPQSPTSSAEDLRGSQRDTRDIPRSSRDLETPIRRHPSPIESTSKDRSSVVFNSSPAGPSPHGPHVDTAAATLGTSTNIARSPSIHGHHRSREEDRAYNEQRERHGSDSMASNLIHRASSTGVDRATFSPPPSSHLSGPFSPPRSPLPAIHEHRQSNDFAKGAAITAGVGAGAALLSRDTTASPSAKSLGRSKSRTSSLRNLRGSLTSLNDKYEAGPSSSQLNGKGVAREAIGGEMADFDGYGHAPGTPQSPTRPPSITKRRSMQQIQDLQTRVELLANENRSLAEQKIIAERHLEEISLERNRGDVGAEEGTVRERDEEILRLREEVDELMAQHESLKGEHEQRYQGLIESHEQERGQWDENSRELETLKGQHTELSTGMEEIVRHEIEVAVREKNAELERLYGDLELAKEKIRELQSQVLRKSMDDDVIVVRDEDYFDNACQTLCQHVQQWVLRFSKFSDTRVCRTTNEVRDDKVIDRFDNAVLDGSEVDGYLGDRVKRRDVFMSVVMTMIWEYVFTRYLFGMDRDQRQKLKQLEKNLAEVGTTAQVHQWRAMTLTLLSKRTAFKDLCENETEGVAIEIFNTLGRFLPPPGNLEQQIMESLRNVMRAAVTLSIEMRTQKAEYIMLPPLQPEYDTNGDLARKVYFNASLMNERSGEFTSNDELQAQQAVVRMVLFPLVVKKGNDEGEGEEEIVVCPAQVLVARVDKGKKRRSSGKSRGPSGQMSVPQSMAGQSTHSLAMSGVEPTGDGRPI